MIVKVRGTEVVVQHADDLKRLKIVTDEPTETLDSSLRSAGLGRVDESADEALLDLTELRRQASATRTDPQSASGWDSMVAFARQAGWVTDDSAEVRAHVERPV